MTQGLGWVEKKRQVIAVPAWYEWGIQTQIDKEKSRREGKVEIALILINPATPPREFCLETSS